MENIRKKPPFHFYKFLLKPINNNLPLLDYNKLKEYGIWKKNKFIFKGGFGSDKIMPKNTNNHLSKYYRMERMFNLKSIINNYNRDFFKKSNDTSPPKDLFNPPVYYNYYNLNFDTPKFIPNLNDFFSNDLKQNETHRNHLDDYFEQNEFKRKNIYNNLQDSYSFYKGRNKIQVEPLHNVFDHNKKIEKKELNNSFKFRMNIIKSHSMKQFPTSKYILKK